MLNIILLLENIPVKSQYKFALLFSKYNKTSRMDICICLIYDII